MTSALLALALALPNPSGPCPLRQSHDTATSATARMTRGRLSTLRAPDAPVPPAAASSATPPTPPVPPAPPLQPGPAPHLFGHWPSDTGTVSAAEDMSVDDAITGIAEEAHLNLVLNSGSDGEADIEGALHAVPLSRALGAILSPTPLIAEHVGGVVVVHPAAEGTLRDPLAGSGIAGGSPVEARADARIDDAVLRVATAAGWSAVCDTGEAGDALVRVRLHAVPADQSLRALLTGTPLAAHLSGSVVTVAGAAALQHPNVLTGLGSPGGKRITLAGKKRVDATLEKIAHAAGWTAQLETEDAGDALLVLDLHDVPVEQALAAVLAGTPLSAKLEGTQLTVTTPSCTRGGCTASAGADADDEAPAVPDDVLQGFDGSLDEQFSGEFAETPVDEALRKVADSAELSLVLPRALKGTVTAHFHDAEVEDVLRAICSQNGLRAVKRGSVITVERQLRPGVGMQLDLNELIERTQREALAAVERSQRHRDQAQAESEDAANESEHPEPDAPSHAGDHSVTGDVLLGPGEKARDLVALRGNAKLGPGAHAREVTAVFGSVDIGPGAVVEREVTAIGGDVRIAPGARVGDVATAIGGKVIIAPGASVRERKSFQIPGLSSLGNQVEEAVHPSFSPLWALGSLLAKFALYFALGLILLVFWPRRLERVADALFQTPARSTAIGMLGLLAVPILTILLFVTVVGIPLVLVEGLGLLVAEVLGFSALSLLVGRRLPIDLGRGASVANLALGTGAVVVATQLPVIGWLVELCAAVVVLGAVLSTRFGQTEAPQVSDAPLSA